MLEIKGKYGSAKFTLETQEEASLKQGYNMLNSPVAEGSKIVFMPDNHPGQGCMVGTTMTLTDKICPNFTGVDIGCGVDTFLLPDIKTINFDQFDKFIRQYIPSGFNRHDKPQKEWENYPEYNNQIDLIIGAIHHTGQNESDVISALSTLGGGNHFLELDKDDNDNIYLTIHSGSRNFGLKTANFYQDKARDYLKSIYGKTDAYKTMEFLPLAQGGEEYLEFMNIAQLYALLNRNLMARKIIQDFFKVKIKGVFYLDHISSIHNYINLRDNILRKGAVSAYKNERIVIPFNMSDGIVLATGLGNPDWNFSAPHGAGRIGSRTNAKATLSMETYKESMKGIWTSCISTDTLDESKAAYKDKDIIINAIKDTVTIDKFIKPIYNFKASEKSRHGKLTKEEKLAYAEQYKRTMGHSKKNNEEV